MEFNRFGGTIPGTYWGCCAVDIIQNFKFDPAAKASSQVVSGDGGGALMVGGSKLAFVGPTYADIFRNRIRFGTFNTSDMPNHIFLAVLTESQVQGSYGAAWLKILREEGFEFIRATDNSVYTGASLRGRSSSHPNYLFGLFRNITGSRIKNPLAPPAAWTALEKVIPEACDFLDDATQKKIADGQTAYHKDRWSKGKTVFMTEDELVAAGAPVMLAGARVPGSQPELKSSREARVAAQQARSASKPAAAPFAAVA